MTQLNVNIIYMLYTKYMIIITIIQLINASKILIILFYGHDRVYFII